MSSAETFLHRAAAYIEDARDLSQSSSSRFDALDTARAALLDARRAHADPSLLIPLFNDLLTTSAGDSSHDVRIVVPHAIEDLCYRDIKSFASSSTSFLLRSLHDDHVLVIKRAVRALNTVYRKLIGFAVSVGISADTFPEAQLTVWLQMHAKAISYIEASDDGLRKAATKFAESVVLALSYSGGGGSPDHFTLDYLEKHGSTSPLLNAAKLRSDGVTAVKAVAQLVRQALEGKLYSDKPNGDMTPRRPGLPPSSFMTAIFVLGILVRRRPTLIEATLPPLLNVVSVIAEPATENLPYDGMDRERPRPCSQAFLDLSQGQQLSILNMLKLSLHALRGYAHTRSETWNIKINRAIADLVAYDQILDKRNQDQMALLVNRQQKQVLSLHAIPKEETRNINVGGVPNLNTVSKLPSHLAPIVKTDPSQYMQTVNPNTLIPIPQPDVPAPAAPMLRQGLSSGGNGLNGQPKRPRPAPPQNFNTVPAPRISPGDAFAAAQIFASQTRPRELVNFIMTRLLLDIPLAHLFRGSSSSLSDSRRSQKRALSAVNSARSPTSDESVQNLQSHPNKLRKTNSVLPSTSPSSQHLPPTSSAKRQKRTRFTSERTPGGSSSTSGAPETSSGSRLSEQTKKAVRKTMPSVAPAKLSSEATDRLIVICSKRMVQRESTTRSCGAGPLRLQLLARILSSLLFKRSEKPIFAQFCDEVCQDIVRHIDRTIPLAIAWLHSLAVQQQFSKIRTRIDAVPTCTQASKRPSSTDVTLKSTQTKAKESSTSKNVDDSTKGIEHVLSSNPEEKEDQAMNNSDNNTTCTTKPNINNSNSDAPPADDVASNTLQVKEVTPVSADSSVGKEPLQIDDQTNAIAAVKNNKSGNERFDDEKTAEDVGKNSGSRDNNESGDIGGDNCTPSKGDANKPPKQTVTDTIVAADKIEPQTQSQTLSVKSSIGIAGEESARALQNNEAAVAETVLIVPTAGTDVTMTEKRDDETVAEEVLSDSDEGYEDDDTEDFIDSEIVDKLDDKGGEKSLYTQLLSRMLNLLRQNDQIEAEVFGKLIADAPILPHDVLQFMLAMCTDPSSIQKGLQTMCTVAMQRPGKDRIKCLSLLFNLACNDDAAVRGPTVRLICNRMYVEPGQSGVRTLIEQGAVRELGKSVDLFISSSRSPSLPSSREDSSNTKKNSFKSAEIRLQRVSLLFTALCAQKHELVLHLGEAFVKLPRQGKDILKERGSELGAHVGISSQPLVDLVGGKLLSQISTTGAKEEHLNKGDGAEELALALLHSGVEKNRTGDQSVVDAAIHRYEACGDLEFVIAVLEGLSRDQVITHLSGLVEYAERGWREREQENRNPHEVETQESQPSQTNSEKNEHKERGTNVTGDVKAEVSSVSQERTDNSLGNANTTGNGNASSESDGERDVLQEIIGKVMGKKGVDMRPDDFLMELHKLKPTQAVGVAIQKCLKNRGIFKQAAIAQAIQQLMDFRRIPEMFMRTVILARVFYPEMEAYLNDTVMTGLISKKVWTNQVLWDGFALYCVKIKKAAVRLLLKLPVKQLEDALKRKSELRALFRDVNRNKNLRKIPNLHRRAILSALKDPS